MDDIIKLDAAVEATAGYGVSHRVRFATQAGIMIVIDLDALSGDLGEDSLTDLMSAAVDILYVNGKPVGFATPVTTDTVVQHQFGYGKPQPDPAAKQGLTDLDRLAELLPALYERVKCPMSCRRGDDELEAVIVHLNDYHKWTREAIADWLDTLNLDLAFPGPEPVEPESAS